jgi:hypothetical protein
MKLWKKLTSFVLVFAMAVTVIAASNGAEVHAATGGGTVTISVEKFTIGQGYLIEPTKVEIEDGETVFDVVKKTLADNGYKADSNFESWQYLSYIENADTGKINIPNAILEMEDCEGWDSSIGGYAPVEKPTNDKNDGNTLENNALGTGSYCSMAGWYYGVNNQNTNVGMGSYEVKDGDVIRLQFTLYGYGADLGLGYGSANLTLPDRDKITEALAYLKAANVPKEYKDAYEKALEITSDLDSTEAQINDAYEALPEWLVTLIKSNDTALAEANKNSASNETALTQAQKQLEEIRQAAKENPVMTLSNTAVSVNAAASTNVSLKYANNDGDTIKNVKSSNENVATASVKNGKVVVTGVKKGTATITVTSKAGATATVNVTVNAKITLNKSSVTVKKKKSTTAVKIKTKTVSADQIASAKSSKTSVATVSVKDGKLTIKGKKKGNATVTVTSEYGATATVKVTVK